MKNGRLTAVIVGIIGLVLGMYAGSISAQLNASDKFVSKEQYRVDIARLEQKLDTLIALRLKE